jgi:phosphatidylglycerophosphatase A
MGQKDPGNVLWDELCTVSLIGVSGVLVIIGLWLLFS